MQFAATSIVATRAHDISVVICSRNRPVLLKDAVRSVLSGTVVPAELLIVDQSDDPSDDLAAGLPPLRYIHDARTGLSAARNLATSAARFDSIAFTDDDVIVAPDWLEMLLKARTAASAPTVFTGRVLPHVTRGAVGFVPPPKRCDAVKVFRGRQRTDPLTCFNMLVARQALEKVGGFDERLGPGTSFPAGEDNELAHRLLSSGWTITTVPEAIVCHRNWRDPGDFQSLQWQYGRGHGAFFSKHTNSDLFMVRRLVGTVCGTVRDALRGIFRSNPAAAAALTPRQQIAGNLAFAAGVVVGFVQWRINRARDRVQGS